MNFMIYDYNLCLLEEGELAPIVFFATSGIYLLAALLNQYDVSPIILAYFVLQSIYGFLVPSSNKVLD